MAGMAGALAALFAVPEALAQPASSSAMVENPCALPRNAGNDWAALCKYQAADKQVSGRPRAVFIGDSITEWWLPNSPALFAGGVVNRGIAGQTSPQMLVRFTQDVVRLRPRVVHIMAGTNDLLGNTGPTSAEEYVNTITAMTDIARANGIAVVIGSVLPTSGAPWKPEYRPAAQIDALNRWLRDFARASGFGFADYYAAMVGEGGAMKPGLATDGVHPSAAGYAVMEPIARAALAEAEKRAGR
ncbi:SGNH/GDSL hydrolase family protein [Novosphingobium huizhouense]|uniref:SGNH/GDSL hydrolase family protein n=1 Tax=Novosphingobium huizhouense TaxID=2866625 RepID=UPI001CD90DDC|nr:SGNH/GDSL hydrolase family protein [Novosphingobium huizhouense]